METTSTPSTLHEPVLRFELPRLAGELRLDDAYASRGHNARTLAKYADLRLVLLAMRAGSRLHEHRTAARIAVQVLSGRLRVHVDGRAYELAGGELLAVDRSLRHDVEALEESAFLLTLSWPDRD